MPPTSLPVIGTALDKAIEMTFDPKDKQKDYCDPSDTLIEARAVLLDTIAEVLPEKGLKRAIAMLMSPSAHS